MTAALSKATRTVPIVFVNVGDPVASGFVENFARPGGNVTGFANFEPSLAGSGLNYSKPLIRTLRASCISLTRKQSLLGS
jgi:ABC transporter substrate binding protein